MKIVNIPYFKEVVIMSTVCDSCGYKSNEVKAGGAIAPHGKRITLKVTDPEDLSRDVLKVCARVRRATCAYATHGAGQWWCGVVFADRVPLCLLRACVLFVHLVVLVVLILILILLLLPRPPPRPSPPSHSPTHPLTRSTH